MGATHPSTAVAPRRGLLSDLLQTSPKPVPESLDVQLVQHNLHLHAGRTGVVASPSLPHALLLLAACWSFVVTADLQQAYLVRPLEQRPPMRQLVLPHSSIHTCSEARHKPSLPSD